MQPVCINFTSAQPTPDTENTNKSMFVIVISTVILTGTVISFLGLVLLFILKNQLKTCHISEMQTDNSDIHRYVYDFCMLCNCYNFNSCFIYYMYIVIHNKQVGTWFMNS